MKVAAKLLAAVAVFALAIWILDVEALAGQVRQLSPGSMALAAGLVLATFLPLTLRWIYIADPVAPVGRLRHVEIYLSALFLNSFSPAAVAGDVYRTVALRQAAGGIGPLVVALLRERLLGLVVYCGCGAGAVATWAMMSRTLPAEPFVIGAAACFGGVAAVLLAAPLLTLARIILPLARMPRLRNLAEGLHKAVHFGEPGSFLVPFALGAAAFLVWALAVLVVARDVGLMLPFPAVVAVVALTEVIRLLPLTFQGGGVREGAAAFLVGAAGGDPSAGFVVAAMAYGIMTVCLLAFGPLGLLLRRYQRQNGSCTAPEADGLA